MILNVAILGFGYWGPNLVRNFAKIDNCNILYIVDKDNDRLNIAKSLYPNTQCINNALIAIKDKTVDAIIVALPVSKHYKYAKLALDHNKHILVEKPCTDSKTKFEKLVSLAKSKKLSLLIDYTFLYTSAVQKIKKLIDTDIIGDILFFDAQRMNLGTFRNDVNVIWDLAVHDISIMKYIIKQMPVSVIATGISHTKNNVEDMAYLSFKFKTNQIAHINCSWNFPFKNKKIFIGGSKKTIVYDDIEPTDKIKIYDKGYNKMNNRETFLVDYRMGDIFIPKLSQEEALLNVCNDFLSSINKKNSSLTNSQFALQINSILSACSKSLLAKGKEISI